MGIFFLTDPLQIRGKDKNEQPHVERQVTSLPDQSDVIMLCHISAYSGTSESFWSKNAVFKDEKDKCEDWIEEFVPQITVCHHSEGLMMPNGDTRHMLLYPTLTTHGGIL